jgi:hypothetical protein
MTVTRVVIDIAIGAAIAFAVRAYTRRGHQP